jgi:hypothetical protein
MFDNFDPLTFYTDLKELAKHNFSEAHILQHKNTANLALSLAGISKIDAGAFSANKSNDTAIFRQGNVTGKKTWVSNLKQGQWAVFQVIEEHNSIVVLVEFDQSVSIEPVNTLGLEDTNSGNVIMKNSPAIKICDKDNLDYFQIQQLHHFSFITNYLGITESLFEDINNYTKIRNINVDHAKNKILIGISSLRLLWQYNLNKLTTVERSDRFWHERNTLFALAKKNLVDVCQLFLENSFNDVFIPGTPRHQRYKDALLLTTHGKNLYFSSQEELF